MSNSLATLSLNRVGWIQLWFLACSLFPSAARAAETDFARAIEKLRAAVEYEVEQKQLPALSIALVAGQQQVWAAGFGFEDVERGKPASAETIYRVGSVSKLFTDLAIMQLAERGQLNLDSPVERYLPDFAPDSRFGKSITLRQLMSHQSGLVREPPVGHYFDPDEPGLSETVRSLNATSLVYQPGMRTKYSNAAISVLGLLLERQLGISYDRHIDRSILQPLGMAASRFERPVQPEASVATGWMRTYDGRRFVAPEFELGTGPAGSLYSSVNDLSKFVRWVLDRSASGDQPLLSEASFAEMITPVVGAQGEAQQFGLGFHLQNLDGHRMIGHGGAIYGFSTQLEALPECGLGVVAACALDGSNGVVSRLAHYALRLMLAAQKADQLPEYIRTVPVAVERARRLVGSYQAPGQETITQIEYLAPKLYLRHGTFRYELRSKVTEGTIVADDPIGFGLEIELLESDQLQVGDDRMARIPDRPPRPIPERWKGLIGEYGWDHNTLYILEDAGRLFALIEWFYYYPLTEVTQDEFAFPDYGLYHGERLVFERESGQPARAVVAAEVRFERRAVGATDGETFRITPVLPMEQLREAALRAEPPAEEGQFRDPDLVDLASLNAGFKFDIRYATTNNFMGAVFYRQPRAFLQRPAAEGLLLAQEQLREQGLGILIYDAYRPWHVTKMFWDATPTQFKDFVANPATGSRHNRGCAVDIGLYDIGNGSPVQMVAGYDEFSDRSFPLYPGGTSRQRWHRDLLRRTMESSGFSVYEFEWWHFDYRDWQAYPLGNQTFDEISP